jgi:hypothetical protein
MGVQMSVALMVSQAGDSNTIDYSPVATQGTFRALWIPACDVLGLKLIPLFESGLLITGDMFDDLLGELGRLEAFARQRGEELGDANLIERIQILITKLSIYKNYLNTDVWIG